jgi:hypothetical protein
VVSGEQATYPKSSELLDEAQTVTGLADFGAGDFREGLDVLLASLDVDSGLSPSAAAGAVDILRRRLVNRLEIEEWYRTHPELDELTIEGPVSVTGLPRTGTTALGNLLSLDDQFRPLRIWEQAKPCPPPRLNQEANDPRRVATVKEFAAVPPEMKAIHIFEVDASTEDTEVLGLGFRAQQMTMPVFGYHDWWRDTDMRDTYAYHRRVAVLLQSQRPPNRWLFKCPHQKFHLEDFLTAYPDARFVMTHRDPAKVVPSYTNFVEALFPAQWRAEHDPATLGRHISNHLRVGMERAIDARARIGEDRFLDVHHREFIRDTAGTFARIYDFLGLDLRPQVQDAMRAWQRENGSAHGAHRYSAEQYGLSVDQIRSDYDFYIRHFDVELEG